MHDETYEDQFGRIRRRVRRMTRAVRWPLKRMVGAPRTILVELRWRLGDEIMALPVFESLRAKYPSDYISVLTNFPELFEEHPFVDSVNAVPAVVDRYVLLRGAPRDVYRLQHYCRVAGVGMPVSRPHVYFQDWSTGLLEGLAEGQGPVVAVAPGTTWPTKHWRMDRWRELCGVLQARGARVVELGRNTEPVGVGLNLMDKTSVREAACVLHQADLLISCDSGLMHLALAANTPVVGLFGPTEPDILIQNEPNFYPIRSTQECQGYWNKAEVEPDMRVCPWKHACCLDSITVDHVMEVMEKRWL
ncbi:MAG TPA: glycosyltransferase family 9 protein [Candidatus Hydrogenedentes bacterium]|nr:glycosyltransferase family 9 protein [Candidatus Hydrogenedentota bacterium]